MDKMDKFVVKNEKIFGKWERNLANLSPEETKRIAIHALTSLETLVSKDISVNIYESVTKREPFPV